MLFFSICRVERVLPSIMLTLRESFEISNIGIVSKRFCVLRCDSGTISDIQHYLQHLQAAPEATGGFVRLPLPCRPPLPHPPIACIPRVYPETSTGFVFCFQTSYTCNYPHFFMCFKCFVPPEKNTILFPCTPLPPPLLHPT